MKRILFALAAVVLASSQLDAQPVSPFPSNAAPLFGLPMQQGSSTNPFTNVSFTGQALGPLNCSTAPAYSFTALPTYGFGALGTSPCVVVNGTQTMGWSATAVTSTVPVAIASDAGTYSLGASSDAILARDAAAAWQLGINAAGVTNQMLKGPDRITSDGVGGNLTIAGGRNRGASAGGSVIIQTAPAAGAGVTGTLTTVATFLSTGAITTAGDIAGGGSVSIVNGGSFFWATRGVIGSPANGTFKFSNSAISAGVVLDTATDSTLKLFARDGASAATLQLPGGSTALAPLVITNGTNLTTATANAVENDGVAFYKTQNTTNGRTYWDGWNYFRLTGSGSGITTIADFFGSNSGIPLVANKIYEIEWVAYFSQATAGTATWTVTTATTALASLTGEYMCSNIAGIGTVGAPQTAAINVTGSSATAFPVTGTEATAVTHQCNIRVMLQAGNGASNTRLRLTMSAGTATPLINSYQRVRQLPDANTGAFVP